MLVYVFSNNVISKTDQFITPIQLLIACISRLKVRLYPLCVSLFSYSMYVYDPTGDHSFVVMMLYLCILIIYVYMFYIIIFSLFLFFIFY